MGDLRNKMAKMAREAAHKAWMAKHHPPAPPPSSLYPRCTVCQEPPSAKVTVYAIDQGWMRPMLFLCTRHLRPEDLAAMK